MKKKTGFTLIELLAVIVILAVIALIATPIIMNVINDSKKGAAKDAMYGYVKAVELAGAKQISPTTDAPDDKYTTENGNLKKGSETITINFKGTKPKDGGEVTLSKGNVIHATLEFDGIPVEYDGKNVTTGDSGSTGTNQKYIAGAEVYYNPETNKKCSSGEVNTENNAKTGCLKWNVITKGDTESKTAVDIMLDHNTTKNVAWNSSGDKTGGMKEVAIALANDVTTWNSGIKSTARLITGQEVADIVENKGWTTGGYSISLPSQSWLYQNLSGINTDAQPIGYWTSTVYSSYSDYAWIVYCDGTLHYDDVSYADYYGVRPVVTISKSVIS